MNNEISSKLKYFLYPRKSSEGEDRQVASIDSQIEELKKLARREGLEIVDILPESKSAKAPGRPIFNEMMARIHKGEASGIICWKLDRLARNPVDGGTINWMLQQNVIQHIRTYEKSYYPTDNVLLMSVEFGMANQFIKDLSQNVKRGNRTKLELGWRPGMAPVGYINELVDHTILPDPARFELIKRAWNHLLSRNFTVPQIHSLLNEEWGFRTIKRRHSGNKPLALSSLYTIFTNPFYAGIIVHNGREYPGKHQMMITLDEFQEAQRIVRRADAPRPQKHTFDFTGLIKCGECGSAITAETKKKFIKKTREYKEYTYYHCTRRKMGTNCTQRQVISEDNLNKEIMDFVNRFAIEPQFLEWALNHLKNIEGKELEKTNKISEMQENTLHKTENQLATLTQMRYRDLIGDDEYLKERTTLQQTITRLKANLSRVAQGEQGDRATTAGKFEFAAGARKSFEKDDREKKRDILIYSGSNQALKDNKLSITAKKWLTPIVNSYQGLKERYRRLEPTLYGQDKSKSEALTSLILDWQAR